MVVVVLGLMKDPTLVEVIHVYRCSLCVLVRNNLCTQGDHKEHNDHRPEEGFDKCMHSFDTLHLRKSNTDRCLHHLLHQPVGALQE